MRMRARECNTLSRPHPPPGPHSHITNETPLLLDETPLSLDETPLLRTHPPTPTRTSQTYAHRRGAGPGARGVRAKRRVTELSHVESLGAGAARARPLNPGATWSIACAFERRGAGSEWLPGRGLLTSTPGTRLRSICVCVFCVRVWGWGEGWGRGGCGCATHARKHARTHARTHAHAHTHMHTRTHSHAQAHTDGISMGWHAHR